MFQNISQQEVDEEEKLENINNKKSNIKTILKNMFTIPNIIVYIVAFMISTVSILDGITIFAMAMFAAACSNGVVAGMVYIATLAGTFLGLGQDAFLSYLLTSLFFMALMLIVKPRLGEEGKNEKLLLGKHLIFSIICIQAMALFSGRYLVADLLSTIYIL